MGHLRGFGVLGAVFMVMRLLQAVTLISVVGLTGSLVRGMVEEGVVVPSAIVGTLVVACTATAYILTSSVLYWKHLLPLLIATAADTTCLIAFVIASVILGKPVHDLNCETTLPRNGNTLASALFTTSSSSSSINGNPSSKSSCHSIKATWALSIASAILFLASAIAAISLWNTLKRRCCRAANRPRKTIDCE